MKAVFVTLKKDHFHIVYLKVACEYTQKQSGVGVAGLCSPLTSLNARGTSFNTNHQAKSPCVLAWCLPLCFSSYASNDLLNIN